MSLSLMTRTLMTALSCAHPAHNLRLHKHRVLLHVTLTEHRGFYHMAHRALLALRAPAALSSMLAKAAPAAILALVAPPPMLAELAATALFAQAAIPPVLAYAAAAAILAPAARPPVLALSHSTFAQGADGQPGRKPAACGGCIRLKNYIQYRRSDSRS